MEFGAAVVFSFLFFLFIFLFIYLFILPWEVGGVAVVILGTTCGYAMASLNIATL